jgi:hypothetical protein
MTYAFIDGQESASLAYYERLLRQTADNAERAKIQAVIEQIRRRLADGETVSAEPSHSFTLSSTRYSFRD